jgi:hypothetical protein
MRAGPLSDARAIELLNGYFVPVYVSNDDIPGDADTVRQEKAERGRILGDFLKARMSAGAVHAYVLTPDGKPFGSLHVAHACEQDKESGKTQTLLLLEKAVAELKPEKGKPIVKPAAQSAAPKAPADALMLHLTARKLAGKGSWNQFPSESWIVLKPEQWGKLLPAGEVKVGSSWEIDKEVVHPILTHFFPQTEVCTAHESKLLSETGPYQHRLEDGSLKGTVIAVEKGVVRARLDGRAKVLHKFYPNPRTPPAVSAANVVGYVEYDATARKVKALRLVTEQGKFEKVDLGVAVRSVSEPESPRDN